MAVLDSLRDGAGSGVEAKELVGVGRARSGWLSLSLILIWEEEEEGEEGEELIVLYSTGSKLQHIGGPY